ncbi:MAG TPA: peptidoglycan-binding domain-containing protein, partial [Gaiellaceae bacterium]|nr:peptidoglycan-binding domain-containing protein [Gaiellaceae bacterium]
MQLSLREQGGATVPIELRSDGTVRPTRPVPAGTRLVAEAVFRRPGWAAWIAGRAHKVRLELTAPTAGLVSRWLRVKRGAPVRLAFTRPVRQVALTGPSHRTITLPHPARTVVLGRLGDAGSVGVRAVALGWERLPRPTTVTWFPPGRSTKVLTSPRPGAPLRPDAPLRLTFSDPVAALGGRRPVLKPRIAGRWRTVDAHTLEFTPRGYGFGLAARVRVELPAPAAVGGGRRLLKAIAWRTPAPSELRLEELLALLRYLPLGWRADVADAPRTMAGQLAAAVDPPEGRFTWRYPDIPRELSRLWEPGRYNVIVRGAIMAFQNEHHLTVDGFAGHDVWQALIADVLAGTPRSGGYSYVYVHSSVPTSLNLWHDGRVIL